MTILNEIPKTTSKFYNDDLHKTLVKYFPYINNNNLFDVRTVEGSVGEIYKGDFYGLLASLNIPFELHRINTEFNNLISPIDYTGEIGSIKIIKTSELEKIAGIFKTNN